jgi:Vitamin K epoxide reductase family
VRRYAVAVLAFAGLCIASYLTLYQVGVLDDVWEPFFGDGSRSVLDWTHPVPDAAAGVIAYAAEVVLSFVGDEDRVRTAPWAVLALGVVIVCGAVTSIALLLIQPLAVGDWCTLCVCSAVLSLVIFALAIDEPLTTLRLMRGEDGPAVAPRRGMGQY